MLFALFDQFKDNPPTLLAYLAALAVAWVTGLGFHEFCHAWSAYKLGDRTAQRAGRLTLNPIKHIDPMGTIVFLVMGFGWAKPTPVNPSQMRYGPVRGGALVSFAGPASNFFFAALAALPLKAGLFDGVGTFDDIRDASGLQIVGLFLTFVVFFNILLGIFNLIPIPPLDGFDVAMPFLPRSWRIQVAPLRQWGPGLLILLFILPFVSRGAINPLGFLIGPVLNAAFDFAR